MAEPVILTDVVDRIGTITLNRPARHNALNPELIAALDAAVREMAEDDAVKVVILTGTAPEGRPAASAPAATRRRAGRPAASPATIRVRSSAFRAMR